MTDAQTHTARAVSLYRTEQPGADAEELAQFARAVTTKLEAMQRHGTVTGSPTFEVVRKGELRPGDPNYATDLGPWLYQADYIRIRWNITETDIAARKMLTMTHIPLPYPSPNRRGETPNNEQ